MNVLQDLLVQRISNLLLVGCKVPLQTSRQCLKGVLEVDK